MSNLDRDPAVEAAEALLRDLVLQHEERAHVTAIEDAVGAGPHTR